MNKTKIGFNYIKEDVFNSENCCENLDDKIFDGANFVRLAQDSWFSIPFGGADLKLLDIQISLWPEKDVNLSLILAGQTIDRLKLKKHESLNYRIPIFDKISEGGIRKIYLKCDGECGFSITALSLNYMVSRNHAKDYAFSFILSLILIAFLCIVMPIRSHHNSEKC